jgi:hypothetical protein
MIFDSDSVTLALDNCSSYCLTNDMKDFVDKPQKIHKGLMGLGTAQIHYQGTVIWSFEDDTGKVHSWKLPNTNYSPDTPIRLFSIQHWAQTYPNLNAHSDTNADRITLEWDRRIRTVPLNAANVGFIHTATGFNNSSKVMTALTSE